MKMRDTEYEARRLLISPDAVPPHFQHPKIISQALKYAGILNEQQQKGPKSKVLCPMEVVLKVLPKVLQGFWLPPPNTSFNMPSQQLSQMAVGVTKAVQDQVSKALSSVHLQATFSSSIRDNMDLSIQEKPQIPQAVQTPTDEPPAQTAIQNDFDRSLDETEPEPDSVGVSTPPRPLTTTDEPSAHTASPEPDSAVVPTLPCTLTTTDELPAHTASPEPDSAVVPTLPHPLIPPDEPPVNSAVEDNLTTSAQPHAQTAVQSILTRSLDETQKQQEPSPEPDYTFVDDDAEASTSSTEDEEPGLQEEIKEMISAVITTLPAPAKPSAHIVIQNVFNRSLGETERHTESDSVVVSTFTAVKKTNKSKFRCFVNWLQKNCCCFPSGDNEVN
ncbi:arginine-glutamic acid dipeptide repeats protein-like isoform X2 [Larimichthys crocea]|uniref:arginine-glutamic acid dipeptide repeats protein-like isoform X2 n=1 Tax=Larimichthys crocea TaxID=215358 RepID=UPI000F5E6534|nr:arginine-glutamic acid dipeptide repeats protein-like isoform X2 [Larimichthys crocea]